LERDRTRRRQGASASEHAVNALTQAIRDGIYGAGDRLVESRLTRELGVSRSTLREVLRRLGADGLIRLEPNKGAIVRSLTRKDVIELLQVREVLEGFAAGLAARNAGVGDNRSRIQAALDRIAAIRRDRHGVNYLENNSDFHQLIIDVSGNRTLAQQIRQLQMPYMRSWYFEQLNSADWNRSLNEHEQILLALLDGDAALAEQLMSAHIRRTRKMVGSLPDEVFDEERPAARDGAAPPADVNEIGTLSQ
jgi:DNA-binding GntR family transcriptional regulator